MFEFIFDGKYITFVIILIFLMKKFKDIACFPVNLRNFSGKKEDLMGIVRRKKDKKVAYQKGHHLRLKFYYIFRKQGNSAKRSFTLIDMPPNFICFRQKIGFKRVIENFISVEGYARAGLSLRTF